MRRITALILFLLVFSDVKADTMSDFVNDIVNNIQTVGNNAFEAQKRGYFVGGSVRYSVPNPTIQPLSFSPPRISAGCGGVDISLGSFSYLKFDDLVQKLQAVLQVAPALAFQLVLSNLCERCQAILSALESISDIVNSLNMDACTLAKAGVGYAMKFVGAAGKHNVDEGKSEDTNDWIKTMQTNLAEFQQAIEDWKKEVTGAYDCMVLTGQDYDSCVNKGAKSGLFFDEGVLEYIRVNSRLKSEPYFELIIQIVRAYIGDLIVSTSDVTYISPCSDLSPYFLGVVCSNGKNASAGSPMKSCAIGGMNVTYYAETVSDLQSNSCKSFDHQPFIDSYENTIQSIYQKMRSGQDLDANEQAFIVTSVFPVYTYLNWIARAEELGFSDSSSKLASLSNSLAQAMYIDAFYYRLSILLGNLTEALSSVSSACATAQKDASDSICREGSPLNDYLKKVKKLQRIVSDSRKTIWDTFKSDFNTLRKNYENSWRFVINTLRTYGLEKSYNFSASAE